MGMLTVPLLVVVALFNEGGSVYWQRGTCTGAERGEYHEKVLDFDNAEIWTKIIKRYNNVTNKESCFTRCYATKDCRSVYWTSESQFCYTLMEKRDTLLSISDNSGRAEKGNWIGGPLSMKNAVDRGAKRYTSCNTFCNFPNAACMKDCTEPTSCAVEQSSCAESVFGFVNLNRFYLSQHGWHNPVRTLLDINFPKRYPNTHLRIRVVSYQGMKNTYQPSSAERGVFIRPYFYHPNYGHANCHGAQGTLLRSIHTYLSRANYPNWGWNWATSGYNYEAVCNYHEYLPATMYMRFREDCQINCGYGFSYTWGYHTNTFVMVEEVVMGDNLVTTEKADLCPERTSFNLQQRDFSTQVTVTGTDQLVNNFYITYKKRSSASTLRIYLRTSVYNNWSNKVKRFEFKVNGMRGRDACEDKNDLVASILWYTYGQTSTDKSYRGTDGFSLDGICRGLVAGTYTFQLFGYWGIDPPPGTDQGPNYHTGHGGDTSAYIGKSGSSNIIVEEINEGVPVSAVLMDDGTLRRFNFFNRRYEIHGNALVNLLNYYNQRPFTYTKLHDDSMLHVSYYGGYGHKMSGGAPTLCKNMFIRINGYSCNDPGALRRRYYVKWAKTYYSKPEHLEGYCKRHTGDPDGIKAGEYTFTINGEGCGNNHYSILGSGTTGHWMVEEIFL